MRDWTVLTDPRRGPEQPSLGAWGRSGRWWVVIAGTLQNERPLREELGAREWVDGETSLAGLVAAILTETGSLEKCLQRLEGAWALSVWDNSEKCWYVARDRGGARQVYGYPQGTSMVWSSAPPRRIPDPESLRQLLLWGLLPAPKTPWKDTLCLSAGTLLKITPHQTQTQTWYTPPLNPTHSQDRDPWLKSVGYACDLAIRNHLSAAGSCPAVAGDGLFASAILGKIRQTPRKVFCHLAPADPLEHREIPELLSQIAQFSLPLVSPGIPALLKLARLAQQNEASALVTGYGGAQLSGEDRVHTLARQARYLRFLPERLALALKKDPYVIQVAKSPPSRWLCGWRWRVPEALDEERPQEQDAEPGGPDPLAFILLQERKVFLPQALFPALVTLSSHTLPILAPFASPSLQALTISTKLLGSRKFSGDALSFLVPNPPPRKPMNIPIAIWLRGPLASMLRTLPEDLEGIFPGNTVKSWIIRLQQGENLGQLLWGGLVVGAWRRHA